MRSLKKLLLVAAMVLALGMVGVVAANAADFDTVDVTVTVQSLGVSVSPAAKAIGVVAAGSTDEIPTGAVVVTNSGNVSEKYKLKLTDPASWTAVATLPGSEEYRLEAVFKGTQGVAADFDETNDVLATGDTTCDGTKFATAADQDGYDVATTVTQDLYFCFDAPSDTAETTEQSITVTVTALVM